MIKHRCISLASICCLGVFLSAASADYLEDFTTNQALLFEFGAYINNNSFSSDGFVSAIPAGGDTFGGMGVAPVGKVDLSGVTAIEVTARIDSGNASDLVVAIREQGMGAAGEFFSFGIPATSFSEGSFTTVVINDFSTAFNGDSTNGMLDGMLDNTGIQSPFGGTAAQSFTVQSVNFVGAELVPEPGTISIMALGLCGLLGLRRRR